MMPRPALEPRNPSIESDSSLAGKGLEELLSSGFIVSYVYVQISHTFH